MGGLRKYMPVTFATYAIGMMALSGVPLLFSGFWSKDEILHAARGWSVSQAPFYLGAIGALFTAFYMTRQVALVFFGSNRSGGRASDPSSHHSADHSAEHAAPHESPAVMTIPLVVLAAFAILLGFIGTPAWPWFQSFLNGEPASVDMARFGEEGVLPLMLFSTLIVSLGLGLGWWFYGRKPMQRSDGPDPLAVLRPDIFGLLRNRYFVDELYEHTVIAFNAWWARACDWLDRWIWNGLVELVSYAVIGLSWVNRFCDEYVVNLGFDEGCRRLRLGGSVLSRLQNGRVQNYLRVIGIALAALVLFLIWGCRAS
jgi:NADH-quinone oxidoreductase subunit L